MAPATAPPTSTNGTGEEGFEGATGGYGAADGEGAVRGDVDVEVERPVDAPLVLRSGMGEAGAGVDSESTEVSEVDLVGGGVLLPEVELGRYGGDLGWAYRETLVEGRPSWP